MFVRLRIAWLIGVLCVAGLSWAIEAPPGLPVVSIDDFPREVREQVQQAYKAASTHPGDAEASGKFAMLLDLYNRPDDAARCYQRAQQLGPQIFKWFYYEGTLRSRQKKQLEAAALFRQALKLDPTYLPARLKYAASLLESVVIIKPSACYPPFAALDSGFFRDVLETAIAQIVVENIAVDPCHEEVHMPVVVVIRRCGAD